MSLRDVPVHEVMTADVVSFQPDENVSDAMKVLVDRGVDAGPVVDAARQVVGMLSTGDLIVEEARVHFPTVVNFLGVNVTWGLKHKEMDEAMAKALGATVGEVMASEPWTVGLDASVEDAATLMHDHDVSRLAVVDADGALAGIISRGDIVKAIVVGTGEPDATDGERGAGAEAMRATRAEVDLDAVAHNVRALRDLVAPAALCAVVKADGYGHGAVAVSEAALAAGASWLGVALVEEGVVLRRDGVEAPILLLSQPRAADVDAAVRLDLRLTVDTHAGVAAMAAAAARLERIARLHLKVNTGMNRMGAAPDEVVELAAAIAGHPELELEALWTHCAVADEPDNPFTDVQLDRFEEVWVELDHRGLAPSMRHAANTAAGMDHPRSRYDLVRAGIGIYGLAPSPALADRVALVPALTLRAEVAMVKRVPAGESISYGQSHTFARAANVATVPIGYADGVVRRLSFTGGQVLVGGRRRAIVGAITMDQLMVDCGDDPVAVDDEVVLIGAQGEEVIGAQEWADRLDTIGYEVVCGIGPRVPRHYRRARAGQPDGPGDAPAVVSAPRSEPDPAAGAAR